jgi:hypothetical protein
LTLAVAFTAAAGPAVAQVVIVNRPDTTAKYDHYVANRAPLAPSPVVRLPMGAVRAAGWLKRQLELQADGFHGHLTEISGFLNKKNNAWLSKTGQGERGWEEVPYWFKGFLGCAYLLDEERMIQEANVWIEGALNSQQEDGWFGPDKGRTGAATDLKGRDDLWPNMIMLFCLQTYYERTSDPRVLKLMEEYFRYLSTVPEEKFLGGYWPAMRGGDQLYSILWLYNITGQPWLLDLAHKTHRRTARWDTVTDTPGREIVNWHNVNIAQAFREPAVYWMLSQNAGHLAATEQVWGKIRELYGQVPGGMFGADENTRPGYNGPRQAIETCGIAEEMLSDGLLISMTGDPAWAERCEKAAFNSYPASMTADLKALRYLTAPNQPQSDHTNKAPGVQNGGPMFHMNPHDHRCCQHNSGHSWPYFTQHLWYAAPGNGLAAYLYAPCEVQAQVADGVTAKIVEDTRYPFEEQITFKVSLPETAAFPLYLRIPAWCDQAQLTLNGEPVPATLPAGKLAKIERTWKDGDQLVLALPMQVKLTTWTGNRGTVSVNRGPLTYSLQIKEEYKRHGGTDEWPAWDIFPGSPWNYGLVLSDAGPATFQVVQADWPADNQPFGSEAVPVRLTAKAKRIPHWILDPRGCVNEIIQQPVKSAEPEETVTLIPMGAARLRISAFPVIGSGPEAQEWPEPQQPKPSLFKASASHCFDSDTVDAVGDALEPRTSNDHEVPRLTWWPHRGTDEWVQYDLGQAKEVSAVSVYWFDDTGVGQCRVPQAWKLLYPDGEAWKPVGGTPELGVAKDRFNRVTFTPVTTTGLRLAVQLQPQFSGGILEWKVESSSDAAKKNARR